MDRSAGKRDLSVGIQRTVHQEAADQRTNQFVRPEQLPWPQPDKSAADAARIGTTASGTSLVVRRAARSFRVSRGTTRKIQLPQTSGVSERMHQPR
jgi:hypothetical protein